MAIQCSNAVYWKIFYLVLEISGYPSISRSDTATAENAVALKLPINAKAPAVEELELEYFARRSQTTVIQRHLWTTSA